MRTNMQRWTFHNSDTVSYTWSRRLSDGRLFGYTLMITDTAVYYHGHVFDVAADTWVKVTGNPAAKVSLHAPIPTALASKS